MAPVRGRTYAVLVVLVALTMVVSGCSLLPGFSSSGSGQRPATATVAPTPTTTTSSTNSTLIPAEEVTQDRVKAVLDAANITYKMNSDGEISATVSGLTIIVQPIPAKSVLKFYALYQFQPGASLLKKLELCNRFNDKMLIGKMAIPEGSPDVIWIDHDIITTGGLTETGITESLTRFASVVTGGLNDYDTDNIVQ
jgi:hypothetical protein